MFLFLTCTHKVFGSVDLGYADADQDDPDQSDQHTDTACCRQESLIVCTAEHRQQDHVQYNGQCDRHQVIEGCRPHADHRTLLRVIAQKSGDSLRRHICDRVADDIQTVQKDKDDGAESFAGYKIKHCQESHRFDEKSACQQDTQLPEFCIDPVVQECDHRICDGVKDTGSGQNIAYDDRGDPVSDAGAVACQSDQGIDAHADQSVAGI